MKRGSRLIRLRCSLIIAYSTRLLNTFAMEAQRKNENLLTAVPELNCLVLNLSLSLTSRKIVFIQLTANVIQTYRKERDNKLMQEAKLRFRHFCQCML